MRRDGWFRAACCGLLALSAIGACAGRATDLTALGNDSESHFLVQCAPGGCGAGASCLFGVCTALCSTDLECSSLSSAAVCRPVAAADGTAGSICDVPCSTDPDCAGLGPLFSCRDGLCRAPAAELASSFARACTADGQCAPGLSCIDNACTQRCEVSSDCSFPGASCPRYERQDGTITGGTCVYACEEHPLVQHGQCAFLGERGRCAADLCRETFAGQCGDVGQAGAEWSCYEDLAADVFRARHGALQTQELCMASGNGRLGSFAYRRCADSTCADGQTGCPVSGLVLESQQMPLEPENQSGLNPLLSARAEVQPREPVRMALELVEPAERCEYLVGVRFWNLHLFDGYSYLSAERAQAALAAPTEPLSANPLSTQAIDGGFWQVVQRYELGHADSATPGVTIEDSEADVQLVSGGERCNTLREHVGVTTRDSLTGVVNEALRRWSASLGDTLDCTRCGRLGCELACRLR